MMRKIIAIRYQLSLYCSGDRMANTNSINPRKAKRKDKPILKPFFIFDLAIPHKRSVVAMITALLMQTLKVL